MTGLLRFDSVPVLLVDPLTSWATCPLAALAVSVAGMPLMAAVPDFKVATMFTLAPYRMLLLEAAMPQVLRKRGVHVITTGALTTCVLARTVKRLTVTGLPLT